MIACVPSRSQQRFAMLVLAAAQFLVASNASEISVTTVARSVVLNHMGESKDENYHPLMHSETGFVNATGAQSVDADDSYAIPVRPTSSLGLTASPSETEESSCHITDGPTADKEEESLTRRGDDFVERGTFAMEKGTHLLSHLKQLIQLIHKNDINNAEELRRVVAFTPKWRSIHEKTVETLREAFTMFLAATKSTTTTTTDASREKLEQVRTLLVELHGSTLFAPRSM